jgi:hypothetical protein
MGRRHRGTIGSEQQPLQQRWGLCTRASRPPARALFENGVNLIPELSLDDGLVLTRVGDTLVHGIADVDPIVQDSIENTLSQPRARCLMVAHRRKVAQCGASIRQSRRLPAR